MGEKVRWTAKNTICRNTDKKPYDNKTKTRTAILAIKAFLTKNQNKKIIVIVPTENLKVQWMQELNKFGLFYEVSVEVINSAVKKDDQIDLVILDEHLSSLNSFN